MAHRINHKFHLYVPILVIELFYVFKWTSNKLHRITITMHTYIYKENNSDYLLGNICHVDAGLYLLLTLQGKPPYGASSTWNSPVAMVSHSWTTPHGSLSASVCHVYLPS